MRKYSLISWMLALTLLVVVVGCSPNSDVNEAAPPDTETTEPAGTDSEAEEPAATDPESENKYADKIDLTFMAMQDMSKWKDGTAIEKVLEEKFNVELKALAINPWETEKLQVTLIGGNVPDVMITFSAQNRYRDGIIRSINMDMVEQYMPNYLRLIEDEGPEQGWAISQEYESGNLLQIPVIDIAGDVTNRIRIRKDWMENVGITQPPTTIDELHELFKRFTFNDPDQNGKDDTYGFSAPLNDGLAVFWRMAPIFGAYNVNGTLWLDENGKVQYGGVSERYKQALQLISSWYKEGIIDPSITTDKESDTNAKILAGKVGATISRVTEMRPGWDDDIKKNNPAAEHLLLGPIKGPEGYGGSVAFGKWLGWGMMFGANTTDEQVIRAMEMADTIIADEELTRLVTYGIEGVHHDVVDGLYTFKPDIDLGENGSFVFYFKNFLRPEKTPITPHIYGSKELPSLIQENIEIMPRIADVINVQELTYLASKNGSIQVTEMETIRDEFFNNAVSGKIDIDKEWDGYVDRWNKAGGTLMTELANGLDIIRVNDLKVE